MTFEFKGRTAFITGGASGAGFGQAKVFGREGCKVAIADIRGDAVEKAVAELRAEGSKSMASSSTSPTVRHSRARRMRWKPRSAR